MNQTNIIASDSGARRIGAEFKREEALLKAGALQNAIFNSANFSSIATDEEGVIQIFNVGAERMLGYAAAEVTNKITPADISDPQEVIARAEALSLELGTAITPGFDALVFKASRGIEDIYELTYIRKDGSRFPAVVSVTALRDAQDEIIGYLLIGTDNSARKRAEEALLKAGALQSAIFNSANFSSIATDEKGVIQLFNVGAERMLGYTAAEVLNKITPADISDSEELIARAKALSAELATTITPGFAALVFKASRGIEDIYELTYIRQDGSRFPAVVSVTALRDPQGGIIGYLLIGTDNTARKRVEEASAHFAAIVASSNDAILSKTLDGKITSWNPGAEKLFGYLAEEVIGKTMHTVIPPERPNEEREILGRIARGESIQHFETVRIRKDGKRIDVSVTISPIRNGGGQVTGASKIARDISERKQIAEALQQTNTALENARLVAEKASLAKSEFLSGMSHELRTPLNGIIGFTEFLIDGKPGPLLPKQKEYLGDVLNSGRHLLQLINDVLDLAKVEAGKMELHVETFPVRKAVEEVTAVIQGFAHKKQIAVAIEVGPGLAAVTLDQHKFKQVLYNLLSNAIKFSDAGGRVSIAALLRAPGHFEVQVRDDGIGIKPEDIHRLFNEFEQLDAGTARRFEGTGLGLALTKRIVEFQGGGIEVKSRPGEGSVFTVRLPVQTNKKGTV